MTRTVLWLAVISVAVLAAACGPERDDTGQLTEAQDVAATDVEVGDCFNADTGESITDVGGVPCEQPHVYEVFALAQHDGGDDAAYPGDTQIQTQAEELCVAEFEGYVGLPYEESELLLTTVNPSQESWDGGDRETICALNLDGNAELTGSQRDSER